MQYHLHLPPKFLKAKKILEQKNKILHQSKDLFMKYGFKSITMDDIAKELGISKKTLYQFFTDKNDLVNQTVDAHLYYMESNCNHISINNKDAILSMISITQFISTNIKQANYKILFELKKYFKEAWDKMHNHRVVFVSASVQKNIELGMEQGLFRANIDAKLTSRLYVHLLDFLLEPDWLDKEGYDIKSTHLQIVEFYLRAICTDKGLKILNKEIQKLNA